MVFTGAAVELSWDTLIFFNRWRSPDESGRTILPLSDSTAGFFVGLTVLDIVCRPFPVDFDFVLDVLTDEHGQDASRAGLHELVLSSGAYTIPDGYYECMLGTKCITSSSILLMHSLAAIITRPSLSRPEHPVPIYDLSRSHFGVTRGWVFCPKS